MPWKTSGDSAPVKVCSGWMLKSTSSSGVAPETCPIRSAWGWAAVAASGMHAASERREKRDVCPGDLLAASEGAVDGEPGCTECFCEHAAEPGRAPMMAIVDSGANAGDGFIVDSGLRSVGSDATSIRLWAGSIQIRDQYDRAHANLTAFFVQS